MTAPSGAAYSVQSQRAAARAPMTLELTELHCSAAHGSSMAYACCGVSPEYTEASWPAVGSSSWPSNCMRPFRRRRCAPAMASEGSVAFTMGSTSRPLNSQSSWQPSTSCTAQALGGCWASATEIAWQVRSLPQVRGLFTAGSGCLQEMASPGHWSPAPAGSPPPPAVTTWRGTVLRTHRTATSTTAQCQRHAMMRLLGSCSVGAHVYRNQELTPGIVSRISGTPACRPDCRSSTVICSRAMPSSCSSSSCRPEVHCRLHSLQVNWNSMQHN